MEDTYVEHRYYIRAGGALVAIHKDTPAGPELRYVHRDHLGSTDALSKDTTPAQVDRWLSFDPWGRRRNPNWSDPGPPYSFGFEGGVGKELTHEFTGHTALDHFDLVHMGGRVHDPVLGRVLSPDPFLPAPDSTQGLNRYSYVSNNPLSSLGPNRPMRSSAHTVACLIASRRRCTARRGGVRPTGVGLLCCRKGRSERRWRRGADRARPRLEETRRRVLGAVNAD